MAAVTTWNFTGRLNGVVIGIYRDSYWVGEPVLGELHVLDDTETTLHNAGSTSQFRTIHFWLEDPYDQFPTLESAFKAASTVSFTDWNGTTTNVKIRDLRITRHIKAIKKGTSDYVVAQAQARLQNV
jgi:hypothetical protein